MCLTSATPQRRHNCVENCLFSKNGISFPHWPRDDLRIPSLIHPAEFVIPAKKERKICIFFCKFLVILFYNFELFVSSLRQSGRRRYLKLLIHNPYSILCQLRYHKLNVRHGNILIDPRSLFSIHLALYCRNYDSKLSNNGASAIRALYIPKRKFSISN